MDFKIDFGNALPPPPDPNAPLFASVGGSAFALGGGECVFRPKGVDDTHVMTLDVLGALNALREFRTLDEHIRAVTLGLGQGGVRAEAVRPVLEGLIARGLLISDTAFRSALSRPAAASSARFAGVFIRACDRPAQLGALLDSLALNERDHRGGHRYIVVDDSTEAGAVARHAELLRAFAGASSVRVDHVTPSRWSALLARWRADVPAASAALAAFIARERGAIRRTGGGKGFNLALALAAGGKYAILDDDFLLPLHARPDADRRLRIAQTAGPESRLYASFDAAFSSDEAAAIDPFVAHQRLVGSRLSELLALGAVELPGRDELVGVAPSLIGQLDADTRILASANGHRGHSGSAGRDWLFLIDRAARAGFVQSRDGYLATLAEPHVSHGFARHTLTERSVFTPFVVDARELTAPTAATGRNEDYLFGALARTLWPNSRTLNAPHTMGHRQPATSGPKRVPDVAADHAGLSDFIADWFVQRRIDARSTDPDRRLRWIAGHLHDFAEAPVAERRAVIGEYLSLRRADMIERLQHVFVEASDAPIFWQADVRARIEANARALVGASTENLAGYPAALGADAIDQQIARDLREFADGLAAWPDLFHYAAERGDRLLTDAA